MNLKDLQEDVNKSQQERASLLQQREQLEQQLEMVNTQIGHCEGGLIKLQELAQREQERLGTEMSPKSAGQDTPQPPATGDPVDAAQTAVG